MRTLALTVVALVASSCIDRRDYAVAVDAPDTITITVAVDGPGRVTADRVGISCPGLCVVTVPRGRVVTLTATPDVGATFKEWQEDCRDDDPCVLGALTSHTVTAVFSPAPAQRLSVSVGGTGTGTVISQPVGIDCGNTCTNNFPFGTMVTLTPAATGGSAFDQWSGACNGAGACVMTMTEAREVNVRFAAGATSTLTATASGMGTITSVPAGLNCPGACTSPFLAGTSVALTATPSAGWTFAGWSGACSGVTCSVAMSADRSVTATFTAPVLHNLQVLISGAGAGNVRSMPAGIDCSSGTCNAAFAAGTVVQLTATAGASTVFAGWGGACTGVVGAVCNVTMSAARTVIADFTPTAALTVSRTGTGSGTVTSTPTGISCGADCVEVYPLGTAVTLVAVPAAGSRFVQWLGPCGAIDPCGFTLTAATAVTAEFALEPGLLTVAVVGAGTVTSMPPGISCGTDCTEPFANGTLVTLVASASFGAIFDGWSGACTGAGSTCSTTIAGAMTATAQFSRLHVITVSLRGEGTVVAAVAPVSGPASCSHTSDPCALAYRNGTAVSFSAMAASGYFFDAFVSMVCASSPANCAFTVVGPDSVEAFFCPIGTC